jgi:hypothetical protein
MGTVPVIPPASLDTAERAKEPVAGNAPNAAPMILAAAKPAARSDVILPLLLSTAKDPKPKMGHIEEE